MPVGPDKNAKGVAYVSAKLFFLLSLKGCGN